MHKTRAGSSSRARVAAQLRRINHWLKPGAHLAFSVPDIDSMPARLFKTYWYDLSLPIHLFHFTRLTVHEMLVDAGFDVTMVRDQGTVDAWRKSLVLVLAARRGAWARYLGPMLESRPVRLAFRAAGPVGRLPGASGRLTIWATKRSDG